jgi:predicted lipid carrier protein YhbT
MGEVSEKLEDLLLGALKHPLRLMPLWIEAVAAGVLSSAVAGARPRFRARLKELKGKVFLFEALDIGKGFYLIIKDDDLEVRPHYAYDPDVTMRGEVKVLLGLLLGRVDPDTVFFSRRLEINGDTAAAILFKNILSDV